jgi:hypothetical protein
MHHKQIEEVKVLHKSCLSFRSFFKVLYITAVFPYAILTIFFFRAVTLRGAAAGLIHLLTPKVSNTYTFERTAISAAPEVFEIRFSFDHKELIFAICIVH